MSSGHVQKVFQAAVRHHGPSYTKTIANLKIGPQTRVIFQGFTGRQATVDAKHSLDYGTNIVGGVSPGKNGEHLGLPLLPDIKAAKRELNPDATLVYVAADKAAQAIEQAIEAEIPLIIAVAEHIPIHDMLRIHEILRSQSRSRLVGANSPGMVSPVTKCRLGFHPINELSPGCVGIVAKSGTLSYETIASTTRAGLGQSLVVGIGGDPLPGTDFVDVLQVLEHDANTKGIILVGEIGGRAEEEAVDWIWDYRRRVKDQKPIMALVAGVQAPQGRTMGHAGALLAHGDAEASSKVKRFRKAGISVVNHPSKFGDRMAMALQVAHLPSSAFPEQLINGKTGNLRVAKEHVPRRVSTALRETTATPQNINQTHVLANNYRRLPGIPLPGNTIHDLVRVTFTYDRSILAPIVSAARRLKDGKTWSSTVRFPLQMKTVYKDSEACQAVAEALKLEPNVFNRFQNIFRSLTEAYLDLKPRVLKVELSYEKEAEYPFAMLRARFGIDDSVYRCRKTTDMGVNVEKVVNAVKEDKAFRMGSEDRLELEAEDHGIVYVNLWGEKTIGTLVNGAGLAMNTVDAITDLGGHCTNFLDTGGKATAETVKHSLRIILQDQRVKTVFVNIFGGLTKCDMIAEGIILAYRELNISVPVIVRLRGTNEEAGQRLIADSGLPLHAFDDFDQAARKAISLSKLPTLSIDQGRM